ncbi:hypothetical protein H0X48_05230 [Candidatus Dependentiae bacterium]|nr:hypothetical protein [Candidatus Dependentiae bacterium]
MKYFIALLTIVIPLQLQAMNSGALIKLSHSLAVATARRWSSSTCASTAKIVKAYECLGFTTKTGSVPKVSDNLTSENYKTLSILLDPIITADFPDAALCKFQEIERAYATIRQYQEEYPAGTVYNTQTIGQVDKDGKQVYLEWLRDQKQLKRKDTIKNKVSDTTARILAGLEVNINKQDFYELPLIEKEELLHLIINNGCPKTAITLLEKMTSKQVSPNDRLLLLKIRDNISIAPLELKPLVQAANPEIAVVLLKILAQKTLNFYQQMANHHTVTCSPYGTEKVFFIEKLIETIQSLDMDFDREVLIKLLVSFDKALFKEVIIESKLLQEAISNYDYSLAALIFKKSGDDFTYAHLQRITAGLF